MDVTVEERAVTVAWPDGSRSRVHALWLRDNCPCPECRHESGQRLLDTRSLPDDLAVVGATANGDLDVAFSDGHSGHFTSEWLHGFAVAPAPPARTLWGGEMQGRLPVSRYADVAAGGEALRRWLVAVDELGFAILTRCPTEPGTVTRVAELFGFVRETNYGRLFDVRSVLSPSNLAYTGLGLGAHTDNPYRDPTPTLQLLHCLASSARGGESTLVDGFRVADDLRADDPAGFDLLARTPLRFGYRDDGTELEAEWPVI